MKIYAAAAACVAVLLGSSAAQAQTSGTSTTVVVSTDPVTGVQTTRPATEAEREQVRAVMRNVAPTLKRLESDLAGLKTLEADVSGLKGFKSQMARLQKMVDTEMPVSTRKTSTGSIRVYRDGTTVIDDGDSRTFQMPDDHSTGH